MHIAPKSTNESRVHYAPEPSLTSVLTNYIQNGHKPKRPQIRPKRPQWKSKTATYQNGQNKNGHMKSEVKMYVSEQEW